MGFFDSDLNERLIRRMKGNLDNVVEKLLEMASRRKAGSVENFRATSVSSSLPKLSVASVPTDSRKVNSGEACLHSYFSLSEFSFVNPQVYLRDIE